jgi:ATP/maltotriose-dependent transcriptional regulator MalT
LPFELARTHLCIGERLRRSRRRADARTHLALAHTTFVALGSDHWATRAARELQATGVPGAGDRADAGGEPLTAREREVCMLVAAGATNREAAAALYMSQRTHGTLDGGGRTGCSAVLIGAIRRSRTPT